ncbi:TonB-dependent outer membrane receptor, partial [mine drainage metagenome]
KLPDVTAIDALQRIPGIQISRQLGEGGGTVNIGGSVIMSGYEIRGLPYAETTLNGRAVFSAQGDRVLNLQDIPSSLLAGIEVYKDPTASLLAGGLAGTVNLITHKPFDFHGPQLDVNAGETYGSMIGTARPNFNVLGSDIWHTGIGKVGAMLDVSYHDRAYRKTASPTVQSPPTARPSGQDHRLHQRRVQHHVHRQSPPHRRRCRPAMAAHAGLPDVRRGHERGLRLGAKSIQLLHTAG